MQPVDATEHPCPASAAGHDEPPSGESQETKGRSRPGVAAIEYCLVLSIILVFVIIAAQNLGIESRGTIQRMVTIFTSASADSGGSGRKAAQDYGGNDDKGRGSKDRGDGKSKGRGSR